MTRLSAVEQEFQQVLQLRSTVDAAARAQVVVDAESHT